MKNAILLLCISLSLNLYSQQPCEYPGENSRWDTRFKAPGVYSGNALASLSGIDGYLYLAGSYSNSFGGDIEYNNVVRYDGEKYIELGQGFTCTSCGTGYVYALTQDDSGNIYVGGLFDGAKNFDGSIVSVRNVVKWNITTETWQALDLGLGTAPVKTLAWHNDTLYAAGNFDFAYNLTDTIAVNNIALYSFISNEWDSLGSGVSFSYPSTSDEVKSIQVTDSGTVLVAGPFNLAGGLAVNSVARWNPNTGWDDWNGGLIGYSTLTSQTWPAVGHALQYISSTGDVYATGTFGAYTASSSVADVRQFAKWDGTSWTLISGFGKPSGSSAWSLPALFYDTATADLYIGGSFAKYAPTNVLNNPAGNRIVKYNTVTGTYSELQDGLLNGNGPKSITKWNGKIWAFGSFNDMGNTYGSNLGSFDGTNWDNIGDGMGGSYATYSMTHNGSDIYVSGFFDRLDSISATRMAKWNDATGWEDIDLGLLSGSASNYGTYIFGTNVIGNKLWFGGQFTGVGTTINSYGIGTYDLTTGVISGFGTGLTGSNARVYAIEEFDGAIYIAGSFTGVNGVAAKNVAKYSGGTWSSIGDFYGNVYSLENVGDSLLYIGGGYYKVGTDTDKKRIVAWNGTSLQNVGKGITAGTVYDLEMGGNGLLHIGGSIVNPQQADGSYLTGANHMLIQYYNGLFVDSTALNTTGQVKSMKYDSASGILSFAGEFSSTSGLELNSIGRWSPTHGLMAFGSGVTNALSTGDDIVAIALVDSFVYTTGSHRRLGLSQSSGFGRYLLEDNIPSVPVFSFSDTLNSCDSLVLDAAHPDNAVVWSTGETTQEITVNTSGVYHVSASNTFGCTVTDTFQVNIHTSPVLTGLQDSTYYCGTSLTVTAPTGFDSYHWTNGDTTQATVVDTGFTEVTLEVTDSNSCNAWHTYYVWVNLNPEVDLGPDTTYCGSTTLNAQNTGSSYVWSTMATDTLQTLYVTTTNQYSVVVTDSNNCQGIDTVNITINSLPVIAIPDTVTGCSPYMVDGGNGFSTYSWSTGDTTQTIALNSGTQYIILNVTDSNNCLGTKVFDAFIDSTPAISIGADTTIFCSQGILSVDAGFYNYLWNTGDTTNLAWATQTGWYDVVVTSFAGCSATDSMFVTVHQVASNVFANDSITGCDSISITISSTYNSFVWGDGDTTTLTQWATDVTIYTITVLDANDCEIKDTVVLDVTGYSPDAVITHNFIGIHDTVDFVADAVIGAISYSWNFGDGNSAQGQTVTHTYGQQGTYTVQLIVENECGFDTTEIEVEITVSGIFNIENNTNISMYPNPVNSVLNIKSNNTQLERFEIYNYTGARVMSGTLNTKTINVNRLPKATYILMVYPKGGVAARIPFIKM